MTKSVSSSATPAEHVSLQRKSRADSPSDPEAIEQAEKRLEEIRPTREESLVVPRGATTAARQELIEAIVQNPDVKEYYDVWRRARDDQSKSTKALLGKSRKVPELDGHYGPYEVEPRSSGIGELWWERTDVHLPTGTAGGMHASFMSDGLHLSGGLDWNAGNLWQGNLQVVGKYVLGSNRMPPGGPGRFTSIPTCNLFGSMAAATYHDLGDNWSKGWLHTSQTILGGPNWPVLGQAHNHQKLYIIADDDTPGGADLPGHIDFPRADFNVDPAFTIVIFLEVRFDFQLEGQAVTKFGFREIFRDAVLQFFQWNIQRL